jgi:hypothetical protein
MSCAGCVFDYEKVAGGRVRGVNALIKIEDEIVTDSVTATITGA